MIRGAIFDVDGTLLDSMPVWRDVGARYLKRRGRTPEEGLADILFPLSFEEGTAYLKKQYDLPESVEEIQVGIAEVIGDFYRYEVALKPGVVDFLEKLCQRGIPMVLATTGDPQLIAAAFARLGVEHYFRQTFTCAQWNTSKREPLIYQKAAEFLGCRPEETVVFEDVLHAVHTAAGARFRTVGVWDEESAGDWAQIIFAAGYCMKDFTDFSGFWNYVMQIE